MNTDKWEEEFDFDWENCNFYGDTDTEPYFEKLSPIKIKESIRQAISDARHEVIRQFATGEFVKSDIAEKFAKEAEARGAERERSRIKGIIESVLDPTESDLRGRNQIDTITSAIATPTQEREE